MFKVNAFSDNVASAHCAHSVRNNEYSWMRYRIDVDRDFMGDIFVEKWYCYYALHRFIASISISEASFSLYTKSACWCLTASCSFQAINELKCKIFFDRWIWITWYSLLRCNGTAPVMDTDLNLNWTMDVEHVVNGCKKTAAITITTGQVDYHTEFMRWSVRIRPSSIFTGGLKSTSWRGFLCWFLVSCLVTSTQVTINYLIPLIRFLHWMGPDGWIRYNTNQSWDDFGWLCDITTRKITSKLLPLNS